MELFMHFIAGRLPGVMAIGRRVCIQLPGLGPMTLDMARLPCKGLHNVLNAGVAAGLVAALRFPGVTENVLQEGISRIQGLPHRMQVGEVLAACRRRLLTSVPQWFAPDRKLMYSLISLCRLLGLSMMLSG